MDSRSVVGGDFRPTSGGLWTAVVSRHRWFGKAMMIWYGNSMNGWGYLLMAVGMVLFWVLLVLAVIAVIRSLGRHQQRVDALPAAEQVLRDRFAHGEIDEPEYLQRLDVLRGGARSDIGS